MFNLTYQDKPLEDLDYEETVEYEKQLLKRVLAAKTSNMSDSIINQLNTYLDYVRLHKNEQMMLMRMGLDGKEEDDDNTTASYSLIIGEPETNSEDEDE